MNRSSKRCDVFGGWSRKAGSGKRCDEGSTTKNLVKFDTVLACVLNSEPDVTAIYQVNEASRCQQFLTGRQAIRYNQTRRG